MLTPAKPFPASARFPRGARGGCSSLSDSCRRPPVKMARKSIIDHNSRDGVYGIFTIAGGFHHLPPHGRANRRHHALRWGDRVRPPTRLCPAASALHDGHRPRTSSPVTRDPRTSGRSSARRWGHPCSKTSWTLLRAPLDDARRQMRQVWGRQAGFPARCGTHERRIDWNAPTGCFACSLKNR